jgi:hypothetical protein
MTMQETPPTENVAGTDADTQLVPDEAATPAAAPPDPARVAHGLPGGANTGHN